MIEGDAGISCEVAAQGLINGLERNELMIGSDFIGDVCRVACSGALSWNHLVFDSILNLLSFVRFIYIPVSKSHQDYSSRIKDTREATHVL